MARRHLASYSRLDNFGGFSPMSNKISSGLLGGGSRPRKLRFEYLEQRRLLAVVSVSNKLDIVNGATASIEALLNDDGGRWHQPPRGN